MAMLAEVAGQPRKFTRAEYNALGRAGILREDEHVELIFGVIVEMSPIDRRHVLSSKRVYDTLMIALRERADVFQGAPFAASDESEPEPDTFVAPLGSPDRDHPSHANLVVEVSRTSLAFDRVTKARLYAHANVDEYWIVDLIRGRVEVRRDPITADGLWGTMTTHLGGERIAPRAFPDVEIVIDEILGPSDD